MSETLQPSPVEPHNAELSARLAEENSAEIPSWHRDYGHLVEQEDGSTSGNKRFNQGVEQGPFQPDKKKLKELVDGGWDPDAAKSILVDKEQLSRIQMNSAPFAGPAELRSISDALQTRIEQTQDQAQPSAEKQAAARQEYLRTHRGQTAVKALGRGAFELLRFLTTNGFKG